MMSRTGLPKSIQAMLAAAALSAGMATAAWAGDLPTWTVNAEDSTLGFTFKQYGTPVTGTFESWTADIAFDPEQLAASSAVVEIRLDSIDTGDASRNDTAKESAWFDVEDHPTARFETTGFTSAGAGAYEAEASLTIKGKTVAVTLPFALTIEGGVAHMEGETEIDRTAFGIGDSGAVDDTVTVTVDLTATRSGG